MYIILGLAITIVLFTIGAGFSLYFSKDKVNGTRITKIFKSGTAVYAALLLLFILTLFPDMVSAWAEDASGAAMGLIGAGLSTGLACVGAGYAVGAVGSSALGAVTEDPKMLGRTLIFVGLAEGIAIYGLIISIMILGRI